MANEPTNPFAPAIEGFQVLLLAGAADRDVAVGILDALDDASPSSSSSEDGRGSRAGSSSSPR